MGLRFSPWMAAVLLGFAALAGCASTEPVTPGGVSGPEGNTPAPADDAATAPGADSSSPGNPPAPAGDGGSGGGDDLAASDGSGPAENDGATGGGDDAGSGDAPVNPTPLTWHGRIKGMMAQHCVKCHSANNIGPFPLDNYESAKANGGAMVGAVEAKRMPPWQPDPACRRYQHERLLADADRADLRKWFEAGMPEGDPSQTPKDAGKQIQPNEDWGPPEIVQMVPEPYKPDTKRPDDYRCFLLPHVFEKDSYLKAIEVLPDNRPEVHHVLLFRVSPDEVAALKQLDAREPGPGYSCFGAPGAGGQNPIGGWVPGSLPIASPKDAAFLIPKGSMVEVQIHYNTLNLQAKPDQTKFHFQLLDKQPKLETVVRPLAHFQFRVPPNEANSVQGKDFVNNTKRDWKITGVFPHMHLLGRRIRVNAIHSDGKNNCLVDIPKWDFNWQQLYEFHESEQVIIKPGEKINLECTFDNSAANQPVVNGERLPSKEVRWGENTTDEMCLNYIMTVEEFVQGGSGVCGGFQQCYDSCKDSTTTCGLQCSYPEGTDCTQCVFSGIYECTQSKCGKQAQSLFTCLFGCQSEADPVACVKAKCDKQLTAFDACAAPIVASGQCEDKVKTCNVKVKR